MTKLDEMWAALAKYQKFANELGHGDTWAEMCKLKTAAAAYAAAYDAYDAAAFDAFDAADAAAAATDVDRWAQKAIYRINKEIELNKGK
jgi:hypothetical protein